MSLEGNVGNAEIVCEGREVGSCDVYEEEMRRVLREGGGKLPYDPNFKVEDLEGNSVKWESMWESMSITGDRQGFVTFLELLKCPEIKDDVAIKSRLFQLDHAIDEGEKTNMIKKRFTILFNNIYRKLATDSKKNENLLGILKNLRKDII
jgi:hypothetical protein